MLRLLGVALFVLVLLHVDLGQIWEWLKHVRSDLVWRGSLFLCCALLLKGLRWHVLSEHGLCFRGVIQSIGQCLESYAVGVATPGRVGELLKVGHGAQRGRSVVGGGLLVLAERGIDVGIFLIVAGGAMTQGVLAGVQPAWGLVTATAGLSAVGAACVLFSSRAFVEKLVKVLRRLPWVGGRRLPVPTTRNLWTTAVILALSAAGAGCYLVSCRYLARAVGLDASFLMIAGGVALAGLLAVLPVTIMGLGTRELTFLYVFADFPDAQVLAFSGLVFLVAQIGGGTIALLGGHLALWASVRMKGDV